MTDELPAVAEIDAAALHMARTYGRNAGPPEPEDVRRWAARIRKWASRYPDQITDHGRNGRRGRYDLNELHRVAERVISTDDAG